MSVKKIENFNIHEQPESNTDSFGVEAYLNANWEKTKEAVNNNAEELIQSQKDIDANKNDIENINSKNKSQDDTIEALKAENKLIKEQIPSASVSGNSVHIEDSSNLDFNWKIRGRHYQKQTIQNDNLLILEDTTITKNNITLTIKDGVITIDGTSTASTNIDFKIKKKLKAGTYWHMVQRIGDAPSGNVGFLVMKSGGVIATINGRGGASFTLNEDTEVFYRIWTDKNNIISNWVESIQGNKVKLRQINAGDSAVIELDVEPVIADSMDADMLMKASDLKLTGKYMETSYKGLSIDSVKAVNLNLQADSSASAELKTEIITNKIFSIDGKDKRVVQLAIKSRLTDNQYPIKQTTINVVAPKLSEKLPESIEVLSLGTMATNGGAEFTDKDWENKDGNVTITLKNTDSTIKWTKNSYDELVVTYMHQM